MKNKIKLLSALLIVIFSISLCTVTAFATDPPVIETEPPIVTETPPVVTEPPVTEPPATDPPVTEPPTAPSTKPTKAPTTQPETEEPVYTTKPQNTTSVQYYTEAPQQQYNNYVQETQAPTQSATTTTEMKRIDEDTLDKSDWEEIRSELENSNGTDNGTGDFDFIKKNTKREDDGLWLLIGGILLIVLGVGIIVLYVVYVIRKKRYIDKRKNGRSNGGSRGNGNSKRDSSSARKPRGDYDDGYYRSPRDYSSSEKRQINRRSKFDTGEVEIPRSRYSERPSRSGGSRSNGNSGSRGRSARPSNGSRYRH